MFDDYTQETIRTIKRKIRTRANREAFEDEAMRELWDFMPFDHSEIKRIIDRVFRGYDESDEEVGE